MNANTTGPGFSLLVGVSPQVESLSSVFGRLVTSDGPALITGEAGTGKRLAAEAIHAASTRAGKPFGVVESAALDAAGLEAALVRADGGTLFIPEIADLTDSVQASLLAVLTPRRLEAVGSVVVRPNVRIIATASGDLGVEIAAGKYRPELHQRFVDGHMDLPSLRDRPEDIPLLAERIVADFAAAQGRSAPAVSPEAMDLLSQYEWPGNLQELTSVLQRGMSLAPEATVLDWATLRIEQAPTQSGTHRLGLDEEWKTFKAAKDALLEEWESEYLRQVLERAGGNMTLAARYAGIARGHLYRLLKKHSLAR
jgi:two-component system nitrogen regulation response regulator GlnG